MSAEYSNSEYRSPLLNGRYEPTRPAETGLGASNGKARELRPAGRYEPTRPGQRNFADNNRQSRGAFAISTGKEQSGARFEPRRPNSDSGRKSRSRFLDTDWNGYKRTKGGALPPEVALAEPYLRDLEGTVRRGVARAVWRNLVVKPIKVVFKTGTKLIWKAAVQSWLPRL